MLETDLEILLYQCYCKMFRTPTPFTTTERMLERYCKRAISNNPTYNLEQLINYELGEVKILFDLPEIPL